MICKIKNITTGEIRTIGLPKGRKELDAFLMDFGLNEENGYAHEMVEARTRSKSVNDVLIKRNLTVDEMNAFAYIYSDTRNYWDRDFIRALDIEKPQTVNEFLTVAAEVPFYHFFEASNLEEVGNAYIELTPAFDGSMTARQVGEMMCKADGGKFFGDNLYYVKKINFEDYEPLYYNGMRIDEETDSDEENSVMVLRISEKEAFMKTLSGDDVIVPSLRIALPATEYEIKRALHRFGDTPFIVEYWGTRDPDIPITISEDEDLFKLNLCAELWAAIDMNFYEQEKVSAIRYSEEEEETIDVFLSIFDRLDNYKLYPTLDHEDAIEECDTNFGVTLPKGKSKKEIAQEILDKYEYVYEDEGLLVKTNGEEGLEKYFIVEHA